MHLKLKSHSLGLATIYPSDKGKARSGQPKSHGMERSVNGQVLVDCGELLNGGRAAIGSVTNCDFPGIARVGENDAFTDYGGAGDLGRLSLMRRERGSTSTRPPLGDCGSARAGAHDVRMTAAVLDRRQVSARSARRGMAAGSTPSWGQQDAILLLLSVSLKQEKANARLARYAAALTSITRRCSVELMLRAICHIPRLLPAPSPSHRYCGISSTPHYAEFLPVPSVDPMANCGPGVKTFPTFSKGAGEREPSNHPTAIWSQSVWATLRYGRRVVGQTKALEMRVATILL